MPPRLKPADTATLKDHAESLSARCDFSSGTRLPHLARTEIGIGERLFFATLVRIYLYGRVDIYEPPMSAVLKMKGRMYFLISNRAWRSFEMGGRDFAFFSRAGRFVFRDQLFAFHQKEYCAGVRGISRQMQNPIRKAVPL